MKEYTHQQWLDELKSRFGENVMDWAFKCPACGKVSTIREFIDAGAEIHDSYQWPRKKKKLTKVSNYKISQPHCITDAVRCQEREC